MKPEPLREGWGWIGRHKLLHPLHTFRQYGTTEVLENLRQPINPRYFAFPKLGVIYVGLPKAAISSVLETLRLAETAKPLDPKLKIDNFLYWSELGSTYEVSAFEVLSSQYDNWHMFTVMRHPQARILSAFYDKILRERDPGDPELSRKYLVPRRARTSFEGFSSWLSMDPRAAYLNSHWCPQVDLLRESWWRLDAILRFEDLEGGPLPNLSARLGREIWLEQNAPHATKGGSSAGLEGTSDSKFPDDMPPPYYGDWALWHRLGDARA